MLRRNPLLTLTATVSIALGIGVNSVLFMYADAYILRPLPVADADAVVAVRALTVEGPRRQGIAYANYMDLRERLSSFEGLFARRRVSCSFARARQDSREMRVGMLVSDNFFDVLGVRPERGRTFGPDEGVVPGRDPVVVLSHDFWATVLDADDSVVDDVVWLNGVAFTVIGVTEESFTGMGAIRRPAFYVPAVMAESLGGDEDVLESRTVGRFGAHGATRWPVLRQLLVESALLTAVAGAVGVVLAMPFPGAPAAAAAPWHRHPVGGITAARAATRSAQAPSDGAGELRSCRRELASASADRVGAERKE